MSLPYLSPPFATFTAPPCSCGVLVAFNPQLLIHNPQPPHRAAQNFMCTESVPSPSSFPAVLPVAPPVVRMIDLGIAEELPSLDHHLVSLNDL